MDDSNVYHESCEANTHRKRFTDDEDNILKKLLDVDGVKNWDQVAEHLPGRSPRQCRDRYNNYLVKNYAKKPWTEEEDRIIIEQYNILGPHWVKISKMLKDRSGNNVKNRWHKSLSKRAKPEIRYPDIPQIIKPRRKVIYVTSPSERGREITGITIKWGLIDLPLLVDERERVL